MSEKKNRRPPKYTDEDLKKILIEYSMDNIGEITYLGLEKNTGIKRHV